MPYCSRFSFRFGPSSLFSSRFGFRFNLTTYIKRTEVYTKNLFLFDKSIVYSLSFCLKANSTPLGNITSLEIKIWQIFFFVQGELNHIVDWMYKYTAKLVIANQAYGPTTLSVNSSSLTLERATIYQALFNRAGRNCSS